MRKIQNLRSAIELLASWIEADKAHFADPVRNPKPDRRLLLEGLSEWSRFLRTPDFELEEDGLPIITRQSIKTQAGAWRPRSPRWVDAEVFLLVLLLTIFRGTARIESNISGEDGQHYLFIFSRDPEKVSLLRLILDASDGHIAHEARIGRGTDYRRGSLCRPLRTVEDARAEGKRMRRPRRGREHAIRVALNNRRDYVARHGAIDLSESTYEAMIRDVFRLIDALPLRADDDDTEAAA
jgi:hypothetical protein